MRRGLLASILGHVLLLVVIGVIAAVVDRWQPPPDAVEPAGIEMVADGYRGQAVAHNLLQTRSSAPGVTYEFSRAQFCHFACSFFSVHFAG